MTPNTKLPTAVAAGRQNTNLLIDDCMEGTTPSISNTHSYLAHCHSALAVMKSLGKFPVMLLFLGFFLCSGNLLKAQTTPLCQNPCPPGPLIWKSIGLPCKISYTDHSILPPNPNTFADTFIFVDIAYRIRPCDSAIIIEDYVFTNNADYYISNPTRYSPPPPALSGTCGYSSASSPFSSSAAQIDQAIKDAIAKLLNGRSTYTTHDIYFKGSCRSYVGLSFPAGSYFTHTRGDLPGLDTVKLSANSIVIQAIPCDSGCCKVSYQWQIDRVVNGITYSSWHAVSSASDAGDCASQSLPNYNTYPKKIVANSPGGGTVTGTVVSQSTCKMICSQLYTPPPTQPFTSVESDILSQDKALQLSAAPLPFGNYIRLSSNKNISNALAVVYDINGKKVLDASCLENGELNTSKLKAGVYYIQVWFPDNTVKTIKAIKQ